MVSAMDVSRETLDGLRETGLSRLGVVPWADEFVDVLTLQPRRPGHVGSRPRPGVFHNSMADVMAAPHFLDYAKSLTPLASEYFGEPAHLWSLNAFCTDRDTPYIAGINGLHRDREADKILVLFVLGADTDVQGAQLFVTKAGRAELVHGPKGTAWLADTTQLHCGLIPNGPRMIAWARWANVVPQAKSEEGLPGIP